MDEAPHRAVRLGHGGPVGRHLEDVPMGLLESAGAPRPQDGLLAAQPRSPRGRTARAVDCRAGEAHPGVADRAARGVELDGRGAAAAVRVVDRAVGECRAAAELVVAHEADAVASRREHGHPVVETGRHHAVREEISDPAERTVAETGRKVQQRNSGGLVLDRRQRTVADPGRRRAVGPGRGFPPGAAASERVERRSSESGPGEGEKGPSVQRPRTPTHRDSLTVALGAVNAPGRHPTPRRRRRHPQRPRAPAASGRRRAPRLRASRRPHAGSLAPSR